MTFSKKLLDLSNLNKKISLIVIEKQIPHSFQNSKSMATMMFNYGYLTKTVESLSDNIIHVHPRTWQAKLKFKNIKGTTPKEKSIKLANKLYGKELVNNNDNIADALLIMTYGKLYLKENK